MSQSNLQAVETETTGAPELLEDILSDLNAGDDAGEEVLEESAPSDDAVIEAAMQAAGESLDEEAAPSEPTVVVQTKRKGGKKKAEGSTEPAQPKTPRVTFHGNKYSTVLADRLGGKLTETLVLETADALLEDDALKAQQAELLEELDTKIANKVAEKCIMLMRDVQAGGHVGNNVMKTAFVVLKRDGQLTTGDKGNLQKELIKHYSIGTTRSQANQVFVLFPFLKITKRTEKGTQAPNPESTILGVVNAALGLAG